MRPRVWIGKRCSSGNSYGAQRKTGLLCSIIIYGPTWKIVSSADLKVSSEKWTRVFS